jgi:hypothetical protein
MPKHLLYGAQRFQLRDDEDVEALAERLISAGDSAAWVTFEDHAGDQHLVLRNSPFPIVLSQEPPTD